MNAEEQSGGRIRDRRVSDRLRRPSRFPWAIVVLILSNSLIEGALTLADRGLWLTPDLRPVVFLLGAFFPGLLSGETPLFPAQPLTMFVTHAFLHGGLVHLCLNMLALYLFGVAIIRRVGTGRFLVAYALSALGGALGFLWLGNGLTPMVGASGALFGLLGVWSCWDFLDKRVQGVPLVRRLRPLFYLLAYNLAFVALLQGQIAWEAHLGGFIVGWVLALIWGRPLYHRIGGRPNRRSTG